MDEFKRFIIINVTKKSTSKQEYDCQPFPKVNPHNLNEVTAYKDILKKNKNGDQNKDYYNSKFKTKSKMNIILYF